MTVHVPAVAAPVAAEVDVLVCGGGLGGVAAATAAARAGARTLLVERNSYLGGVATAGMCCSIFNCYLTASGVSGVITRSSTGLPYLDSPIWKYGVSGVASMKLPAEYT